MITIEEIHASLVNGQRRQMVEQIDEYGTYDFFTDYERWLSCFAFAPEEQQAKSRFNWFADCVISYHRIVGN